MSSSHLKFQIAQEYQTLLGSIEPPGTGCHQSLIQPTRKGVRLGLSDEQILADLRAHIPQGARRVADSELRNTIRTARNEEPVVIGPAKRSKRQRKSPYQKSLPSLDQKKVYLTAREIIQAGVGHNLTELSPVNVAEIASADFVRQVYQSDDMILLGDQYSNGTPRGLITPSGRSFLGLGVASRDTYIDWLLAGNSAPLIWPQPFTGKTAKTKDGTDSYRCNGSIKAYRHCVIEFDDEVAWPLERQQQFWAGVLLRKELPVVAVLHSGNKSLHAWLPVKATNPTQWKEITGRLLDKQGGFFGILKADPAGRVPSQGFRLPGHLRKETGNSQKLLYFNPENIPTK
jgi:hypothetical protein